MIRKLAIFLLITVCGVLSHAQVKNDSSSFWKRVFLPSIDIGYQTPSSDLISGGVRTATSIEYRIRNNNDFFLRLNYDTHSAKYNILESTSISNNIEGTVQFTDFLIGPGYRMGDNTFRIMFSFMSGVKSYEFPSAVVDGQRILVRQKAKSTFTTFFLTTLEYYIDQKSALTLSVFQNQVWKKQDFWTESGSSFGISLGFITSLL